VRIFISRKKTDSPQSNESILGDFEQLVEPLAYDLKRGTLAPLF
jgi:hypothetical protein